MAKIIDRRLPKQCDVCGAPAVDVRGSATGPITFAYCDLCLKDRREPIWSVVASLFGVEDWEDIAPDFIPVVEASLETAGWDRERLFAEIRKFEREFYDELLAIAEEADGEE